MLIVEILGYTVYSVLVLENDTVLCDKKYGTWILCLVLNNFRMQSLVSGVASVALMAVTHSNYAAIVKSEFNAIPSKIGQGEMDLTAVLKLQKSLLGGDEVVWLGLLPCVVTPATNRYTNYFIHACDTLMIYRRIQLTSLALHLYYQMIFIILEHSRPFE